MENTIVGLNIKKLSEQHLCTCSVAAKLNIIAGDMVYLDKQCEYLVKASKTHKSMDIEVVIEAANFCSRVSKLNEEYKKRVLFDLFNGSRRLINVKLEREPALSLHEARSKEIKSRGDLYMFMVGMCGLGFYAEGEIGVINYERAATALNFWWNELCNASKVCNKLLTRLDRASPQFKVPYKNLLDHDQYFASCARRYEARITRQLLVKSGKLVVLPFVEQCQISGEL